MSYAQNYTPLSNFSQDESHNVSGRSSLKTASVDTEFTNIATSINALNNNIKILQRSDGQLTNGIVSMSSLSNTVKYALGNNPDTAELLAQAVADATAQADFAAADRVQTAADRVQTGIDVIATTANAVATALDVIAMNSAVDAALIQAGVYVDEPTGRAAVADGVAFKVQGAGNVAAYEYRRTNASASVLIATYPSSAYVATKADTTIGKNLFNPNDSGVLTDYIVSTTTGLPVSTAGFTLSGYMLVSPSTAYTVSSGRQMAWYTASQVFISGVASAGGAVTTVTSPINAAFLRASVSAASLATYQVELGSSSTAYEPYEVQLTNPLAEGAVTTTKLAASSVTADKLATNAVTTTKINNRAVSTDKLASAAVSADKTNFMQIGKNKFNKNAVTAGYYCTPAGALAASASYDVSDYIPVIVGTAYVCNGSGMRFTCYFDANYNVVAGGSNTNITTFTPPSGAVYIRITIAHSNLNTFQLEIGATATAYESYKYRLADPANVPIDLILNDDQVTTPSIAAFAVTTPKIAGSAVTPEKTNFLQIGKNKFNKAVATTGFYCTNTGAIAANAAYDISDYIPVIVGTQYVCNGSGMRFTCYFDANYAVVAGGSNTGGNIFTFTPPVGAVYIRVTMYASDINLFQLEIGATATVYADYQYVISLASKIPISATASPVPPVLVMPPTIYGVQGRECNVYIDNLHVADSSLFNHDITNTVVNGLQQRERWTWTPSAAQTTGTLTVSAYDKTSGAALVSATTNQRAAASTAGTGLTKVINVIGDSLINAATITQTVIDIAASDVMAVSFIGTRGTAPNKHEGRGGWNINDYSTVGRTFYSFTVSGITTSPAINSTEYTNNGSTFKVQELALTAGSGTIICERTAGTNAPSASGTLTKSYGTGDATIAFSASSTVSGNPFWIGGALNYPQYLVNNSLATPDWVLIHLGINDAFSYTSDAAVIAAATAAFNNLDLLITSIKTAGAGVKVGLMIPTPPASQDGFGAGYGTGQTAWRDKRNIMLWAKELIARYTGKEASRIYLVPTNTALDVVNGYPLATSAPVNSRSSVMVQRQNNGVHPDTGGYQQIGDALWAFLKCNA